MGSGPVLNPPCMPHRRLGIAGWQHGLRLRLRLVEQRVVFIVPVVHREGLIRSRCRRFVGGAVGHLFRGSLLS